jgi:uncharacterized protein (DUF488 family)
MVATAMQLYSIGYEGRTMEELIAELDEAGIDRVIDVRALPLSRKRGFSKTPLGLALAVAGIEYVSLRVAGNPYHALKGTPQCLAMYRTHLARSPHVLEAVREAARDHRAALLCYEADQAECHRGILLESLDAEAAAKPKRARRK